MIRKLQQNTSFGKRQKFQKKSRLKKLAIVKDNIRCLYSSDYRSPCSNCGPTPCPHNWCSIAVKHCSHEWLLNRNDSLMNLMLLVTKDFGDESLAPFEADTVDWWFWSMIHIQWATINHNYDSKWRNTYLVSFIETETHP